MQDDSSQLKKRVIKGSQAEHCPAYDLPGEVRQAELLRSRLTKLNPATGDQLTIQCRKLFNDNAIKIHVSPWQAGRGVAEGVERWLLSRHDEASYSVALGFADDTLQRLGALFFGEAFIVANDGDDVVPVKRSLSDTDQRLGYRLLQSLINALFPALGLPASGWKPHQHASNPDGSLVFSEITMECGEQPLRWICCMPLAVVAELETEVTTPVDLAPQLRVAARSIDVQLNVQLAQLKVTLAELEKFKVGDILPLNLQQRVPARIGSQVCLWGLVAEQGGQLVLKVTERGTEL